MDDDLTIEDMAFTPRAPEKSPIGGTNYVRFGRIECSVDLGVIVWRRRGRNCGKQ